MDPISNMLTAIRNAQAVKKETVTIPYSAIKLHLAELLKTKGFIAEVHRRGRGATDKKIELVLKYDEAGMPRISGMVRKSKPSQRVYIKSSQLKPIKQGFGIAILSTSKGLMEAHDARKAGVGGELICEVW